MAAPRRKHPRRMQQVRLDTNAIDYAILAAYFVVVLGVGFAARRYIKTSLERAAAAWAASCGSGRLAHALA